MLFLLSSIGAMAAPTADIRIGNLLTSAPNGIAFIVKDRAAFVLDPGGDYYAGTAAPDDSYHRTKFKANGVEVIFEWGRVGDGVVGRLASTSETKVHFDLTKNWPGWKSQFTPSAEGMNGEAEGFHWHVVTNPSPIESNATGFTVNIKGDSPVRFVAGFGKDKAISKVDSILKKAAERYESSRPKATGEFGDFLGAIADNLNNSRVYSNDNHLAAITVSRGWAPDPNNAPYFCWDSFFNGNLASLDDPGNGKDTIRAILAAQTAEGLVPNYAHWIQGDGTKSSDDRSQPPMGSLCAWRVHQRTPDLAFLREVYPKLLKWHRWWPTARDGKHDGLLEWGSSKKGMQEALWETGWDDTVHFEGSKVVGNTLDAYAVDLSSMWAMDAQYLALIADATGHPEDAKALRAERDQTARLINEKLWNPKLGIYCSRLWDGRFLTRLTPMNFYPLLAGIAPPERARQVLNVMTDPKRFWGEWALPTVAFDDPVWHEQNYWRGKVWAPVNYIVFQGLLETAPHEVMNDYATKGVKLFMRNWTTSGVCGENYLSRDGTQSSDPHYTWGALLCLIMLENTVGFLPDGRVRLNGTLDANFELHNVRLKGKLYDVIVRPRHTELRQAQKVWLEAKDQVLVTKF